MKLISYTNILLFLLVLMINCSFIISSSSFAESDWLNVPPHKFSETVKSTIEMINNVMSSLSKFPIESADFRVRNAIADCTDLMDSTVDYLNLALTASQSPNGTDGYGTGNVSNDLMTWLSAALTNQDTCKDGLSMDSTISNNNDTNQLAKKNLVPNINQDGIVPSISNLLSMVNSNPKPSKNNDQLPVWLKAHDWELLKDVNISNADVVVSQDGTGRYNKIMDAINAAPDKSSRRYVIYVKKGVYKEYVTVGKKKMNIMMIGDGIDSTIISGSRNYVDGWEPHNGATFSVDGKGFIARDVAFQNTAGPEKEQAVAFRSGSDTSVLYRCSFKGYQDTLFAHHCRQFYRECYITGSVDFIFGNAKAVFQKCNIVARKGLSGQKCTVTAQGRTEYRQPTGFTVQFCNIRAEGSSVPVYLGRPWKPYSRVVVMESYLGGEVRPEGWLPWNTSDYGLRTSYYGEYMNSGPGAGLMGRVSWPGFHVLVDKKEADVFTVAKFIDGDKWLPATGVDYVSGLVE